MQGLHANLRTIARMQRHTDHAHIKKEVLPLLRKPGSLTVTKGKGGVKIERGVEEEEGILMH